MKTAARALLAATGLCAGAAFAQIATDGSLGARQSFTGNAISIPSTVGRWVNGNLFHSFQVFNVGAGQAVTFLPTPVSFDTPTLSNIIGRVTGGTASTILGTVRSTTPGVNLYLINPAGIVFGQGALVDVNGSFYASSAHYLRSADGTRFESRGPGISLTFTTPDGFGFDSAPVAPLAVQGAVLRAREGGTVALVGGGLLVGGVPTGTTLQALGGNLVLVAVASPGVVEYGAQGYALTGFDGLADVLLQRGATMNANEGAARTGGGSIVIRGANIAMDQATVTARSAFSNGREIDIAATRDLTINKSNVIGVTTGAGNAAHVRLAGNNVVVSNGSLVDTSCDPGCTTGNGGLLEVQAGDTFWIDGASGTNTFVVSNSFGSGHTGEIDVTAGTLALDGAASLQGIGLRAGDATAIRIHTGDLVIRNGAQIDASSRGTGRGGQIVVENSGGIRIEGTRADATRNGLITPSGIISNTQGTGNGGGIVISTRTLDVLRGGEIGSSALLGSTGEGGSISIAASEALRVSGTDEGSHASAVVTNTFSSGNAGGVTLTAPSILIADEGKIQSQSEGAGRAGRITLSGGDLVLSGAEAQISSDARASGDAGTITIGLSGALTVSGANSGIFTKTYGPAAGGVIVIDAGRVAIDGIGSGIYAATDGSGSAGRIAVHASDSVTLSSASGTFENAVAIQSSSTSSGNAGSVDVRADHRVALAGNSRIGTTTNFDGQAGSVSVEAGDTIDVSRGSITSQTFGSGNAGSVAVHSGGTVNVQDMGSITTSTSGIGQAGTVTVYGRSAVVASSGGAVTSEASSFGRAGNVDVSSDGRVDLSENARISTSTTGTGDAGTVRVYGRDAVNVSSGASIASESSAAGLAGNLDVRSDGEVHITNTGRVTTSATFSDGGNILVEAPILFMDSGRITTAVGTGQGDGGNMEIRVGTLVMRASTISANAFGGDGGNIHITANPLIKSSDSSITASSVLGVDGTISLDSPVVDPTGQLLAPRPSFLDAGAILAGRCGPRLAGRASSLVIVPFAGATLPGGLHTAFDRGFLSPTLSRTPPACEPSPSS